MMLAILFALGAQMAVGPDVAAWSHPLPEKFASGALVPPAEELLRRSVLVEGNCSRLEYVWRRLEDGETVRIGVIGGSITEGSCASEPSRRWGESVAAGWQHAFPRARIEFFNAGIGATGSDIGAFRLERDVLSRNPDVVFVEFSVNDANDLEHAESYEGLVRHLLKSPRAVAVVLLGMVDQSGKSAREWHAKIAGHYDLPYVSYGDAVYDPYVKRGLVKWSDLSPDAVHPNDVGHAIVAFLVNGFCKRKYAEWRAGKRETKRSMDLPAPLVGTRFEKGEFKLMSEVAIRENDGFFPLRDDCWGIGLACTNRGGRLVFEIEGATVAMLYRCGRKPFNWGKISIRVDGRIAVAALDCYRDQWWWYTPSCYLCKDEPGRHRIEVIALDEKNAESNGYGCHLTGLLVSGGTETDGGAE